MSDIQLLVPDLGDDGNAEVIEILFKEGDQVQAEDIVVVLESDKATMEIPAEQAGKLKQLSVKLGDEVSSGDLLASFEQKAEETNTEQESTQQESSEKTDSPELGNSPEREDSPEPENSPEPNEQEDKTEEAKSEKNTQDKTSKNQAENKPQIVNEKVPDTGSEGSAELIEILCEVGKEVNKDDILFVLESDKATMEIPATVSGKVKAVSVSLGDQLVFGDSLCEIETTDTPASDASKNETEKPQAASSQQVAPEKKSQDNVKKQPQQTAKVSDASYRNPNVHAGPAARRLARELGVDLSLVKPSGPKERILKDDIKAFVKSSLNKGGSASVNPIFDFDLPEIEFSKFGEVEKQKLSRIKKLSAKNLSRSWLTIPHVTQFDEADITELEKFRKQEGAALKDAGIKLTPLAFLVKACAQSLEAFPVFNASLDKSGEYLILKKYIHIGVAVDTENGLVVPVIRDANKKTIKAIAEELATISEKARNKKLMPQDMQGACFSISSLGGIGGTAFTPIVNWPEVAILGVSRSQMKAVYDGKDFQPRLMLPLSLSYDHRVIDGAEAARFSRHLAELLQNKALRAIEI